jgi:hypothetical protein
MIETYEIAEMRAQGDLTRYRKEVTLASRSMIQERRAAVLRHPDLAAQLCDAPLSLTAPEKWTGFVPPETCEARQHQVRNDSPYRIQLAAIVTVAQQRDGRNYGLGLTGE